MLEAIPASSGSEQLDISAQNPMATPAEPLPPQEPPVGTPPPPTSEPPLPPPPEPPPPAPPQPEPPKPEEPAQSPLAGKEKEIIAGEREEELEGAIEEKPQGLGILIAAVVLTVLLLAGLYLIKVQKNARISTLEAELKDLNSQMQAKDVQEAKTKALSLEARLNALQSARQKQILWSQIFKEVQATTSQQAQYTSLSIDQENKVSITGKTENYSSLAALLVGLKNSKKWQEITLVSTNVIEEEGKQPKLGFSISLTFDKTQFSLTPTTTTSTVSSSETTNSVPGEEITTSTSQTSTTVVEGGQI
jgi:Tfp pilus assembly protein PilN